MLQRTRDGVLATDTAIKCDGYHVFRGGTRQCDIMSLHNEEESFGTGDDSTYHQDHRSTTEKLALQTLVHDPSRCVHI